MGVGRLLLFLVATLLLLGGSGSALALDTTGAATAVWRGEREVDVLLRVETDDKGGHVDNLPANAVRRVSNAAVHTRSSRRTGCAVA